MVRAVGAEAAELQELRRVKNQRRRSRIFRKTSFETSFEEVEVEQPERGHRRHPKVMH